MKGALILLGFWGFSALICLPALVGGPGAFLALSFFVLLLGFSTYLYSPRIAGLVDSLLKHTRVV